MLNLVWKLFLKISCLDMILFIPLDFLESIHCKQIESIFAFSLLDLWISKTSPCWNGLFSINVPWKNISFFDLFQCHLLFRCHRGLSFSRRSTDDSATNLKPNWWVFKMVKFWKFVGQVSWRQKSIRFVYNE